MAVGICFSSILMAQRNEDVKIKYRRSSLHTMFIQTKDFHRKDVVMQAYENAPFPEKYNNHTIGEKSFNPNKFAVSAAELVAADIKKNNKASVSLIINKYFAENGVAKKIVAKWFNRQADGSFNMDLIGERGYYDASDMEAKIAGGLARGTAVLADAGEELINNTFVVISKMNFVSNEVAAKILQLASYAVANEIENEFLKKAAKKKADKTYNKTKEGYSVWTTAYLYKLKWNDSIAAVFYEELWMDKSSIDANKKAAFDNSNLFEMEYVGYEKAVSLVLLATGEHTTEEQIITLATIRNIDRVYAKLQRKYDVFQTKVPLYSVEPLTAKIGMKEGLEGGEKFEVYEQVIDKKTGLTKYVSKGKITVDKALIWDNRYNAGEGDDVGNTDIKATTFKGGGNYYPGMLIKQLK